MTHIMIADVVRQLSTGPLKEFVLAQLTKWHQRCLAGDDTRPQLRALLLRIVAIDKGRRYFNGMLKEQGRFKVLNQLFTYNGVLIPSDLTLSAVHDCKWTLISAPGSVPTTTDPVAIAQAMAQQVASVIQDQSTAQTGVIAMSAMPIKIEQVTYVVIGNSRVDIKSMSEDQLFSAIADSENEIKRLSGLLHQPKAIAARINDLQAGIKALVETADAKFDAKK